MSIKAIAEKAERVKKLQARVEQLEAQIERAEARQKHLDRKRRTRRLILFGTVIEAIIADGKFTQEKWEGWCRKYLSERDLKAAGFEVVAPVDTKPG